MAADAAEQQMWSSPRWRADSVDFRAFPFLTAVLIAPVPIGLVRTSTSPGLAPEFVIDPVGMDRTGHGVPDLYFLIINRMAADDDDILRIHRRLAAGKYFAEHVPIAVLRIADDR